MKASLIGILLGILMAILIGYPISYADDKYSSENIFSDISTEEKFTKHGNRTRKNTSSTYNSWHSMKNRCLNPKTPNYKEYGGRGIMVCERWIVFENFLADMGERPEGKTLDRIHNDGHYEPSNCKWSTPKEQANNRRNTKLDEKKINEIKRLTSKGWSNRKIANLMNISHQLVSLVNQGKRI